MMMIRELQKGLRLKERRRCVKEKKIAAIGWGLCSGEARCLDLDWADLKIEKGYMVSIDL